MRTFVTYEALQRCKRRACRHLDGVKPHRKVHEFPDAGLRVIVFYCHAQDVRENEIWDDETGEVLDDVPF